MILSLLLFSLALPGQAEVAQIPVSRVELMPREPFPYLMRDWKQVALDYDEFIFSFTRTSSSLDSWWQQYPVVWWDTGQINFPWDTFGMPSYIGHPAMRGGGAHETINCLAAVVGAGLCGVSKNNQFVPAFAQSFNFVQMEEQYYNKSNGENVVLNYTNTDSGQSFWYELFPNILFSQLTWLYPDTATMENDMYTFADRWYDASVVMGGSLTPWLVPEFNHTAFDFDTMAAVDNSYWKEPDAAAGIAWLEYMAYVKWGSPQHLVGAKWGMEYLHNRAQNPFYETLMPYGVILAARMNAEQDTNYDIQKFLDWFFGPSTNGAARTGWGVIADGPWGGYDCSGLVGSVTDGGGYAFAMNSFQAAAALAPLPRYHQGYARAIGKWMLNLANASRLFYANGLDADYQSGYDWACVYDPQSCISYEGLRKQGRAISYALSEQAVYGAIISGNYSSTRYKDDNYEIIREQSLVGGKDYLEHIWQFEIPSGIGHTLWFWGYYADAGDADAGFELAWATDSAGPWNYLFTVTNTSINNYQGAGLPGGLAGTVYIRAKDTIRIAGNSLNDSLYIDTLGIVTELADSPYAMGDAVSAGRPGSPVRTDFALYGASHVGMLGAVVSATNVEKVLQIDCLATDFFHQPAYPTYLYYNPYPYPVTVLVDAGSTCTDIYDSVSQTILQQRVQGFTGVSIDADSARVLVLAPSGKNIAIQDNQKLLDGIVIDYHTNATFASCPEKLASPNRLAGDLNGDCLITITDLQVMAQEWLSQVPCLASDVTGDDRVDLLDLQVLSSQWLLTY